MNRRIFLTSLAVAIAGAAIPGWLDGAWAQGAQRFSRIVVDTKPLEARGGRAAAAVIRPQLQASLQREFAGMIGGKGPALVVQVHSIMLSAEMIAGRGGPPTDYLEAEVIGGGRRFPLLVTQDNSVVRQSPEDEVRRLRSLADSLASWVRRGV